ncbi:MAG: hypothetical protein CMF51_04615 [Legionellales bacterium]|mgnify:CR=1 FL=1|nr:hypothetical protein [Legionellales bacterium]
MITLRRLGVLTFSLLPICNGAIGFALAFSKLPDILTNSLSYFFTPYPMLVNILVWIGAISLGITLYVIHAKCSITYPIGGNKFKRDNPILMFLLILSTCIIMCCLFNEYQESLLMLSRFFHGNWIINICVLIGLLGYFLVSVDRSSEFLEDNIEKLTWKTVSLVLIVSLAVSNCFIHPQILPLWISYSVIAYSALYLVRVNFQSDSGRSFKSIGQEVCKLILLLLHATAEAGLAAHGAKILGLNYDLSMTSLIIFAMAIFTLNLGIETMVDGSAMFSVDEKSTNQKVSEELESAVGMKKYLIVMIVATSSLSIGAIGGYDLCDTFGLNMVWVMIFSVSTLIVEYTFMFKQFEEFVGKSISSVKAALIESNDAFEFSLSSSDLSTHAGHGQAAKAAPRVVVEAASNDQRVRQQSAGR